MRCANALMTLALRGVEARDLPHVASTGVKIRTRNVLRGQVLPFSSENWLGDRDSNR